MTVEERFWAKVDRDGPGGCWLWTAGKSAGGYGMFHPRKHATVYAHRFAYELLVGPIPDGLELDHLCRVRACVNPGHLEPVTTRVNGMRGLGQGALNAQKTACPAGHPYTPENTYIEPRGRGRRCRTCARARDRLRRPRRSAA